MRASRPVRGRTERRPCAVVARVVRHPPPMGRAGTVWVIARKDCSKAAQCSDQPAGTVCAPAEAQSPCTATTSQPFASPIASVVRATMALGRVYRRYLRTRTPWLRRRFSLPAETASRMSGAARATHTKALHISAIDPDLPRGARRMHAVQRSSHTGRARVTMKWYLLNWHLCRDVSFVAMLGAGMLAGCSGQVDAAHRMLTST